jgi:hypothetical protein
VIKIGDLELYIVTDESIDQPNTVTGKPVEQGADISDHIQQEPIQLDYSITAAGEDAQTIFETLEAMRKAQEVYEVKTEQRAEPYQSMAIEKVTMNRTPSIANGHTIKVNLKQVRIVEQKTTSVNLGKDPVSKKQAVGDPGQPQNKTTAKTEKTEHSSILKQLTTGGMS